jgi:hypothetical protein
MAKDAGAQPRMPLLQGAPGPVDDVMPEDQAALVAPPAYSARRALGRRHLQRSFKFPRGVAATGGGGRRREAGARCHAVEPAGGPRQGWLGGVAAAGARSGWVI